VDIESDSAIAVSSAPVAGTEDVEIGAGFSVHLDNFDGPFDLLLQLISRHKMDITEVSLSMVTDEFIGFIRALEVSGEGWRLDQATEFLVIAATLLDLKAARLLPSGEVEDEEDLALLEARDILFARLLQYRAFKEIAATFALQIEAADKSFARVVALDPALSALLPEVLIGVGPARFAAIAERCLTLVVVARFLALLDLYRQGVLRFDQVVALGELQISWTGTDSGEIEVTDEFDIPVIPTEEGENV
jgi:segregation and condensation protein A